ncbi:hypothetical protein BAMA_04785 [Bacillus manliponensis]|uniref:Uncharacterized protein n=1 Tax=Bacillus manliponensis TaxID=574376 RepID=A0A073K8J0_9BACI|nr:helix-turn-helix transcriptional regulator [Bacillus manliponensis]KEK18578.1 hypothetical protein BAMA_04785 [Bacillus manliponensis]
MDQFIHNFNDALLISEPLYKNNEVLWTKWNNYVEDAKSNSTKIITSQYASPSFSALLVWVMRKQEEGESLLHIYKNIEMYKDEIHRQVGPIIRDEFKEDIVFNDNDAQQEIVEKVEPALIEHEEDYYAVNNSSVYYKLRDGIAKNNFEEDQDRKVLQYEIETKGQSSIAQLSSHKDGDLRIRNTEEAARWTTLMNDVMSNMDDLTADCLDAITIQWLNQAKSPEDFIDFSYEQVLEMCSIPKTVVGKNEYYRAEDKIKVAKRLAALASIFIYLNDDNEVVVLNEEDSEKVEVKREVIKRLFVLDSVVLWRHNTTNEYMGIESCRIKPGSFLTSYLYGSANTTALLSKKALEYNSYRYKYHKRLIRYLTWQWRIRQVYVSLSKPFSIGGEKGLLAVLDIPKTWKPNRIKEQLEDVLMDLEREQVISKWEYSEPLDEEKIGKKNWFKNYYAKLGITILPPHELLEQMEKYVDKKVIDYSEVPSVKVKETKVSKESPETDMELIRNKLIEVQTKQKISIREIAEEISLSPSTLSRFCNKKTKRMSKQAMDKLSKWYERRKLIESL